MEQHVCCLPFCSQHQFQLCEWGANWQPRKKHELLPYSYSFSFAFKSLQTLTQISSVDDFFLCCSWSPVCPIHHVNRAKAATKINISLSSLSDKIEDELEMTTVCHRPEGLEQLEAQTNFTKRELQVLYRGFKNVRTILHSAEPSAYVSTSLHCSAAFCIIPLLNISGVVLHIPYHSKTSAICLFIKYLWHHNLPKTGLDEYSAHSILIKFGLQLLVSTLQFPQPCQYFRITWKCLHGYLFNSHCWFLMPKCGLPRMLGLLSFL